MMLIYPVFKALNVTANCIDLFSELLEPCPYKSFAIIECPIDYSMEYSQAVMISDDFFPDPAKLIPEGVVYFNLERVVTHEISHTWNHFIIGNNPYKEPWLDEGWADYSTFYLYAEEFHSQEIADQTVLKNKKGLFNDFLSYVDDAPVNMSADYFLDKLSHYGPIVYGKASQIIHLLRFVMGDVKFFSSLEAFYDAYSY
ncbi:MAG: M1 family aminopeptidase, partial [Candidatus Hodarchaeales archaeon]